LAEFLNWASGGTDYKPGVVSPTPDQLDYLIGQATGGVGRELMKVEQTVSSQVTGEELPPYKVPGLGRFYGDIKAGASESNRFYENVTRVNKHENEVRGRAMDGKDMGDYFERYPEAGLIGYGNQVERSVQQLVRAKREALKRGDKQTVQELQAAITETMKGFNAAVRESRSVIGQ